MSGIVQRGADKLQVACVVFLTLAGCAASATEPDEVGFEFFEKRVRPLLVQKCYECHSAGKKVKGGLTLDTREGLLKGGDSGRAIVPGKPSESLLIKAVRYANEDLQMPPKHRLEANEVEFLEKWVAMGAPDPRTNSAAKTSTTRADHWAFKPAREPAVPGPARERRAANDIDRFVLAKLDARGLEPSPQAERRTLIRRATFDLIGLPPTPEEVQAFVNDRAPGAFGRVIDRLLSSPHYGERWGRHWLDVVRYSDTAGDSSDYPVPQAYRYRNYVIESFNRDKPYDRFLREQVAGDLLPASSPEQKREMIIATGFIAMARRFSVDPAGTMHLTIEDTLDTIGRSILGLSLSCARCHDHKFDPISTRDYYALYGIFGSTRYPYAGSEVKKEQSDFIPLYTEAEWEARHQAETDEYERLDGEVKRLEKQAALLKKEGLNDREVRRELKAVRQKRDDLSGMISLADVAYAVSEASPTNASIQIRGEPGKLGEQVPRGFLTVLGGQQVQEKGSGRVQLAEWLTEPANPLTARVMVNRIWQHHFGKGLVKTPSDFGRRGQAPTHPELLDYLAARFMRNGWSIKAMHKLMMLSATYQQTSVDDFWRDELRESLILANSGEWDSRDSRSSSLQFDPGNDLLWKYSRQRLDAESIRDAMLVVSGTLERANGGPHPFPPPNRWEYTQHYQFTAVYETRQRSVYLMQQRIRKHPFMAVFDGADPNTSTAERPVTTTPLQALFVLNDRFAHEQAERFAERLMAGRADSAGRVALGYELAYGRVPKPEETRAALEYLRTIEKSSPNQPTAGAWQSFARALMGSNEFIFVD